MRATSLKQADEHRDAGDARAAMRRACKELWLSVGSPDPPVALRPILDRLDASIEEREIYAEGLLYREGGGWKINVRPRDERTWRRQRFTLAHEIGHILLLQDGEVIRSESRRGLDPVSVERLCDIAAAEILMPEAPFSKDLATYGLAPHGLVALYDRYRVSWAALLIRVAELLPWTSITYWKRHARKDRRERTTMRVVSQHRGEAGLWLPAGLTGRYLSPDPFSEPHAIGHGISLRRPVRWSGRAIVIDFHDLPAREAIPIPSLKHLIRRRPPRPDTDALVIFLPPEGQSALVDQVIASSMLEHDLAGRASPEHPPASTDRETPQGWSPTSALTLW